MKKIEVITGSQAAKDLIVGEETIRKRLKIKILIRRVNPTSKGRGALN